MPTSIALTIDGDVVELSTMGQAVVDFSGLLAELDASLSSDGREAVRWELEAVSYSSPFRVVAGSPSAQRTDDRAAEIAEACLAGVRSLGEQAFRPPAFSDEVLERVANLGRLSGNGIRAIRIADPSADALRGGRTLGPAIVTQATARNAAAVLSTADIRAVDEREIVHGSVEGPAEAFNMHEAPFFTVWDAVTGRAVQCYFEESDRERVAGIVADKRIVSVSGTLRRNVDGSPQRIRPVSSLSIIDEPLPGEWVSPSGLFSGISDTQEHLSSIRGE